MRTRSGTNTPADRLSYFAFDPTFTGGVFVAGGQPGGRSGVVLAGAGKTGPSTVPVINAHNGELTQSLAAFPDDFLGGVQVALANDPGGTLQTDPVLLPTDVV